MIFLVRHAHSAFSPNEMRSLSEAGQAAATRVADVLECHAIGAIHSSPYTRAVETVQPLADRLHVPIRIDAELRERQLSSRPADDFLQQLEATWRDFDLAHPGGESSSMAQARMTRAISRILHATDGRDIVIASHGNAIALFLRTLDGSVDFGFWARMSMPDIYAVDTTTGAAWSYRRAWHDATSHETATTKS
jgi:broad specificity phosphatase PhoE